MDLKDIKTKLKESREANTSLLDSLLSESFDIATIANAVFKHKQDKITNTDIERYSKNIRTLTNDPVVLELQEQSNYTINNKYLFIIENQVVAISKDSRYGLNNNWTLDQIKQSIKEELYG